MPPESPEGQAVSGSAPEAGEGQEQTQDTTVQPENPLSATRQAIADELAAIRKKELKDESASGDESILEDSEEGDSEDFEEEDTDESEDNSDSDEDDDSEESDSDEDEEESEDDDSESRIPKKRLDREIEKRKKAEAKAEEVTSLVSELKEQLSEKDTQVSEMQKVSDWVDYVIEAAEYMPELRHFLETNPVMQGKEPSIDDFEDASAYKKWVDKQAEKRATELAGGKESEAAVERQVNEIIDGYEGQIAEMRKDKMMAKYVDDEHLPEIRSFIEEMGLQSLMSGSKRFDTIEKITKYLFIDEMVKDFENRGAEKAVKKIDKSRKKVSLKSKGSAAKPKSKPNPQKMTLMDSIREEISASKAF